MKTCEKCGAPCAENEILCDNCSVNEIAQINAENQKRNFKIPFLIIGVLSAIGYGIDLVIDVIPKLSEYPYIVLALILLIRIVFSVLTVVVYNNFCEKNNLTKYTVSLSAISFTLASYSIAESIYNILNYIIRIYASTVPIYYSLVCYSITTILAVVLTVVFFNIAVSYRKKSESNNSDLYIAENAGESVSSSNPTASQQQIPVYTVNNINMNSPKSKAVAALLCFFLGELGIHRFYAGKIGTGLLWMFTLGFGGIGVFVDFIIILCGSFKDGDGRLIK